jgi:hypothetical protein
MRLSERLRWLVCLASGNDIKMGLVAPGVLGVAVREPQA